MPKYVVSSTLEDPDWNNSTVLKGDVVNEVSKLKQELDGEMNYYDRWLRSLMTVPFLHLRCRRQEVARRRRRWSSTSCSSAHPPP
jgi:hypothetical protein